MWTKTDHPVQVRLHVLTLILVSGLWHIHEAFQSFLGYKLPKDRQRVCVVPWTVPAPWKVFFVKDCIHMYGSHWDTHLLLKNCELLSRKNFSMNQPWKGHIYQRHEKVYGCIVVIFIPKGVNENLNICKKHKARKFPLKTCPDCCQVRSSLGTMGNAGAPVRGQIPAHSGHICLSMTEAPEAKLQPLGEKLQ